MTVRYTVVIKAKASEKQLQQVHETVMKTSPNYFNVTTAVLLHAGLVVE